MAKREPKSVDVAEVLGALTPGEPYFPEEVSDMLDIPRRTAGHHLQLLHLRGDIERKRFNGHEVYWREPGSTIDEY